MRDATRQTRFTGPAIVYDSGLDAIQAEVSPESAIGGPPSLVENGDVIHVDVDARALELQVSGTELAARRDRRGEPILPVLRGYLSIYQRTVQPMSTGAVLVKMQDQRTRD